MRLFSNRHRPVHLGRLPMERLPHADQAEPAPQKLGTGRGIGEGPLSEVLADYLALFAPWRDGESAPERAPGTEDLFARSHDLKAGCYFMNADVVGVAALAPDAGGHGHVLVILVAQGRLPEADNLAHDWAAHGRHAAAALRAGEIAIVSAGYIRHLGWSARAHLLGAAEVDLGQLALASGLALVEGGRLRNPFIGEDFALAAVTTDYPLAPDRPLAAGVARARSVIGSASAVPSRGSSAGASNAVPAI